ncbi:MAG: aminotransferase class IV [Halobacteriaceae archaeon]
MYYHVNGEVVPESAATVSVSDRGFRYGDAAFETLRAYGGDVFEWAAHRERLVATCETLGMADAVPGDLRARVGETLSANDLGDAYVRLSVTRGEQAGKLTPRSAVDPTVVVVVKPLPRSGPGGEDVWDGPATVETVETRRIPDAAVPAAAKTHNYLNGILARLETGAGTDEALMLDADGDVAEGATSNVFFVAGDTLHTPSLDGPVLPGVTRSVVLDIAEAAGVPVETGRYAVADLRGADEAFLTNTTWEIRPVETVDGTPVGGGETTARLRRLFDERVAACY